MHAWNKGTRFEIDGWMRNDLIPLGKFPSSRGKFLWERTRSGTKSNLYPKGISDGLPWEFSTGWKVLAKVSRLHAPVERRNVAPEKKKRLPDRPRDSCYRKTIKCPTLRTRQRRFNFNPKEQQRRKRFSRKRNAIGRTGSNSFVESIRPAS